MDAHGETCARHRAADLVRVLPRAGRGRRRLRGMLDQAVVHRTTLLSAARHSLCLRSRPRHAVDGSDRQPAGLHAGARRGALRRDRAHAGACAEIPGPHRSCARHGPLDGARRARTARWRRHADPGAAALAPRLGPPLQPVRRARARDRAAERGHTARRPVAAGARHRAAGRSVARTAGQQCAGRIPALRRGEIGSSGPPRWCWWTTS